MKLYDMGASFLLGIVLMGYAAKVNHDNNSPNTLNSREQEVQACYLPDHAPHPAPSETSEYFLPLDLTPQAKAAILSRLKPGDVVRIIEGTASAEVSTVKEAIEKLQKLSDEVTKDGK